VFALPERHKSAFINLMHWDFALILIFLATAVPILGRRRLRCLLQSPETTKSERLVLYASTIVFQWLAAALILWRIHFHKIAAARIGLALPKPGLTAVVTLLLAALILVNQLVSLRRLASNPVEMRGILPQLALKVFPQDARERAAFAALVATVACCEELIYRGFAQRVFQDWSSGSVALGIFGSALMFSLAHLYQGRRGLISTFVVGLLFSGARAWTGSLVSGAVPHFVADITAGFLTPSRVQAVLPATASEATESKPFSLILL
jgi:uncharacterized protein